MLKIRTLQGRSKAWRLRSSEELVTSNTRWEGCDSFIVSEDPEARSRLLARSADFFGGLFDFFFDLPFSIYAAYMRVNESQSKANPKQNRLRLYLLIVTVLYFLA